MERCRPAAAVAVGVSGGAEGAAGVGDARKDPEQWKTGDEPMTGAPEPRPSPDALPGGGAWTSRPNLTKAEASKRIGELQAKTGRGQKLRQ